MKRKPAARPVAEAAAARPDDMFGLMLDPVVPAGQAVPPPPLDASVAPAAATADARFTLRSVVSFESKADGEKLHPIDAKRKLEKSLAEIKKAKLARRAERQARRPAASRA